jgi:glutathione S-transferase
VTPKDEGLQDSTPILERIEAAHAEPSAMPDDPARLRLGAAGEYGDEWGNKWMFHYRWHYRPDAWSTAERIAQQMMGAEGTLAVAQARAAVAERMMGRLGFVGSNDKTRPLIEASFRKAAALLDAHLATQPYVLGGRPAMADFGLWGQFYEAATDPTPGAILRASAPHVMAWVKRMLSPKVEGSFETLAALSPTLMPLLRRRWLVSSYRGRRPMRRRSNAATRASRRRSAARSGHRSRRSTMRGRSPRSGASMRPPRGPQVWSRSWPRAAA